MRWRLRVPASVANLGPGFDILALTVALYNDVNVESGEGSGVVVELDADAPQELRDPAVNLVVRSYVQTCEYLGVAASSVAASSCA